MSHAAVVPLLSLWASLTGTGQPAADNIPASHLAMPQWLAPFPQARDQTEKISTTENTSAYTALARPTEVISHYEQQMRRAGVAFRTQSDGIGFSIVAAAENPVLKMSAVIRIREADNATTVKVSYSVADDKPAALPRANPPPQTLAPRPSTSTSPLKRAALSPFAHVPYTWAMQSVIVRSNPPKYTAFYYEPATDRTVETPLTLPVGAAIVDVFPDDCTFSMKDEAGHSFTFKTAEEAKRRQLPPGTWSLYPMKCSGIDVFLH